MPEAEPDSHTDHMVDTAAADKVAVDKAVAEAYSAVEAGPEARNKAPAED